MREKTNGFTKFITKLEGKPAEPTCTWSTEELKEVEVLFIRSLRRVCEGNSRNLIDAFVWRHTPQGHDYWSNIHIGHTRMSEDDREFCRALLEAHT